MPVSNKLCGMKSSWCMNEMNAIAIHFEHQKKLSLVFLPSFFLGRVTKLPKSLIHFPDHGLSRQNIKLWCQNMWNEIIYHLDSWMRWMLIAVSSFAALKSPSLLLLLPIVTWSEWVRVGKYAATMYVCPSIHSNQPTNQPLTILCTTCDESGKLL